VQMAGLRLDVRPSGNIIIPGDAAKSTLVQRLRADARRMPMGGQPLTAEKIDWSAAGSPTAPQPETSPPSSPTPKSTGPLYLPCGRRRLVRAGRTGCATLSMHSSSSGWTAPI
jgi:hypothetical protein